MRLDHLLSKEHLLAAFRAVQAFLFLWTFVSRQELLTSGTSIIWYAPGQHLVSTSAVLGRIPEWNLERRNQEQIRHTVGS